MSMGMEVVCIVICVSPLLFTWLSFDSCDCPRRFRCCTMTVDEIRQIAYTSVLSNAISPCGQYVAFGTTMHRLLVYSISSDLFQSQMESKPHQVLPLDVISSWLTLCTAREYLLCGSSADLWCFKWSSGGLLRPVSRRSIPTNTVPMDSTAITNLRYQSDMDRLYVSTNSGLVHVYKFDPDLVYLSTINAHKSTIHSLCLAGSTQFSTCSEDGFVRFWDDRCDQVCSSFRPSDFPSLARPHFGDWLTALACDASDSDWFVSGGGPFLSLWNRRACRPMVPLLPDDSPETWYVQTTLFSSASGDAQIISGGNSGRLYRWDHSGSLLSSVSLSEPTRSRIGHILLVDFVEPSYQDPTLVDIADGVLVVGGVGPVIRIVSMLGYPLGVLNLR
ncbi:hypothetical protein PHET_07556 [Paragonimus heterotremus]|uniref:THO complex subunit 6 n=1 Tax=Paragonimus heterotremus TaxID=100268 RepID=A0A8J4T6X6_9TREM|nr:hypothetical protein PHET_07556 [Paragonimus heterotremus]